MIIYPFIFVPMRTRTRTLLYAHNEYSLLIIHYSLNKDNCGVIR